METCYSGPKVTVLRAKVTVLRAKATDEGWDPWRVVILMLGTLFCMHKITGESWDP